MAAAKPKQSGEFSMGLGILGAFLGAALGGGLVYGFYLWAGFRFPLSGVAIGALSGYGARLLARGTHTTLGIIAGVLALFSIVAVFYLIYAQLELIAADPKNVNALRIGKTEQPASLVSELASAEAVEAGRQSDLTIEAADFSVPMSGEYFGKVVTELVQNAFKFSESGSAVRVTLGESFNTIVFTVKDHGRGFSTCLLYTSRCV